MKVSTADLDNISKQVTILLQEFLRPGVMSDKLSDSLCGGLHPCCIPRESFGATDSVPRENMKRIKSGYAPE